MADNRAHEHLSEIYGGSLELSRSSIFAYLEPNLRNNPHAAASIIRHQASSHLAGLFHDGYENVPHQTQTTSGTGAYLTWTFQQLHQASVRVAQALLTCGLQPGRSTLITFLPNGIEYHLFLWTCLLLRVTLSNLDPGAVEPARQTELEFFLRSLNPNAVIVATAEGASAVDEVTKRLGLRTLNARIVAAPNSEGIGDLPLHWTNLVEFATREVEVETTLPNHAQLISAAIDDDPDRIFLILFTSGTSTGQPKGCLRTVGSHVHVLEAFTSLEQIPNLVFNANFRITMPAHTLQTWKVGGAIVMPGFTFEPEAVLEAIQHSKAKQTTLVPYHLHALADCLKLSSYNISSLDNICLGGDMFSRELIEKAEQTFVNVSTFALAYGMTEGGAFTEASWQRGTDQGPYIQGVRSVGRTMKGSRTRVVDIDNGKVVAQNVVGEIHICNGSVIQKYLGGIRSDSFYTDQHGSWLKTGDTGLIDNHGYVYILGRSKDIIKRAGVPISPTAIEDCIDRYTGFKSSVFGIPHPTLGQQVFAIVAQYGNSSEDQLKQHILNKFGKDYALAGVASLKQLDLKDFPRNASGKIMKMELLPLATKYLYQRP